jgi:hypothetical protein
MHADGGGMEIGWLGKSALEQERRGQRGIAGMGKGM